MTSPLVLEYREARAAQDARFDARHGAGMVDHSMTATDEYRAYFGLGEWEGSGVERRITFKVWLQVRAAERAAERHAAELAELAELPTHFLIALADGSAAAAAELDRRLGEYDAAHAHELDADVVAETAELDRELDELAAAAPVAAPVTVAACDAPHIARVNTCAAVMRLRNVCGNAHPDRKEPTMSRNATNGYTFSAAELAAIVDSRTHTELTADGWTDGHGATAFAVGDVVFAYVRGAIRRGKVAKIGRTNLTVECTTPGAIAEAANPRFGWSEPCLTAKVVKIAEVYAQRAAETIVGELVEPAPAVAADAPAEHKIERDETLRGIAAAGVAKQSTRMLKVECGSCGYTLRTTAKWLEVGTPTCPCGTLMDAAL